MYNWAKSTCICPLSSVNVYPTELILHAKKTNTIYVHAGMEPEKKFRTG